MISARTAEENLARIRSLMERSTLYRTVSVPAAAWGGFLSVGAWGIAQAFHIDDGLYPYRFLFLWLGVLLFTAMGNLFFLAREARETTSPIFSAGFWSAGRSLFPSFFSAALFTLAIALTGGRMWTIVLVMAWIFFYGLGLLATQHFAPRSIVVLGWLFLLTPCLLPILSQFDRIASVFLIGRPSALMALTFGGYHLGYALIVYLLERKDGPGKEGAADGL